MISLTETLEPRRLLCGTVPLSAAPSAADVGESSAVPVWERPAVLRQHSPLSQYLLLSPREQAEIDPHLIEDDRPEHEQLAEVWDALAARSPDDTLPDALPDMVPLVGGSGGYLQPYIDKTEQPGRNLLRFSTAIGNIGDGPVVLTSSSSEINPDGTQRVTQVIYARQGNQFVAKRTRVGGNFVWHPGHGHFHYEGYADYRLLHSVNGQPGDVVLRADGTPAVGDKVGFCLINVSSSFTIPGTNVSSSTLPNYNLPGQPTVGCGFVQGLHVGRADVYSSIYDGQWIDVTGVPNGNYFLEVTIDGSDTVLEKDESNNTVRVPITLNTTPPSGGIPADRFESPAPNNSFATATDLGELGYQTQSGLTIHANYDDDFFRFTAASTGSGRIQTRAAHGDVNLFLYDAQGNLLRASSNQGSGSATNPETDTVTWDFVKGQTYFVRASGLGTGTTSYSGLSNNYAIVFEIKPTVGVAQSTYKGREGTTVTVSFVRNGPVSGPVTLRLAYGGTATSGLDYLALPSTVTIGNEALQYDLDIVLRHDTLLEGLETLTITVLPDPLYVVDAAASVLTVGIEDATRAPGGPMGTRGGASSPAGRPGATWPPPAARPGDTPKDPLAPAVRLAAGPLVDLFSDRPVADALDQLLGRGRVR
ncbi:MAG: lysyl oxidase family protein [Tepidisphaerales bacterium]